MEDNIKELQGKNKKRRKKERLILISVIIFVISLFISTIIVKKINISKLGNDYCQYNGKHPIETGMEGETHSVCKGCSRIMKFDYRITNELCESCANKLHRCERCGKLLSD